MSRDDLPEIRIETEADFHETLAGVVEQAILNGVDVRGAWEFKTRGSTHYWDVEIFELAREDGDAE